MARTTDQSPASNRRTTDVDPTPTNGGRGPLDREQDQRAQQGEPGENHEDDDTDRRRRTSADSGERDRSGERHDLREDRDDERTSGEESDRRESRGVGRDSDRGQQGRLGEGRELGGSRVQGEHSRQWPALSTGSEAYTPVLEAWTRIFRSWSELAGTMVKVQQETFVRMMGGATTGARTSADARSSADADRDRGDEALSSSRWGAATTHRIERDRR